MRSEPERAVSEQLLADMAWVRGLARALVTDAGLADDLVQDTWLAVLARGLDDAPPRRWLSTVVRNFWRQNLRGETHRGEREQRAAREEALPSADELALRMERQRLLAEAITRLDEPYRSTLILRYSEGLEPAEIERRQGLPGGTVRRRLSVGLERLRADLERHFGDRRSWMEALAPLAGLSPALETQVAAATTLVAGAWTLKKLAMAAALLVLLGGGLFVVLQRAPDRPSLPVSADGNARAQIAPRAGELALGAGSAENGRAPATAAANTRPSVSISGRVRAPADCAPDETAEVFACEDPLDYSRFSRMLDGAVWDSRERAKLDGELLARAAVASDGSFRLELAEARERVWLQLRGRHVFLDAPFEVELPAPGEVELRPASGAWLRGSLLPDGGALGRDAGTLVALAATDAQPSYAASLLDRAFHSRVRPAADGTFEFRAVPAGKACELLVLPQFRAAARIDVGVGSSCGELVARVPLRAGGRVRGTVVDPAGEPLEGARVEALLGGRWYGLDDALAREGTSGAGGRFELEAVPVGRVLLRASRPGCLESAKAQLEVEDGALVEGVVLALETGETIAGRVLWPDGTPAAGAHVAAEFDPAFRVGAWVLGSERGASGEATSRDDGSFEIRGLGSGPFVVRGEAHTRSGERISARRDGRRPADGEVELVLHPARSVEGRVVDPAGKGVASFAIRARRIVQGALGEMVLDERSAHFADEHGRFALADLEEGEWELSAEADGLVTRALLRLSLDKASLSGVELVLSRGASVAGRVLSESGAPIAGAEVRVDDGGSSWLPQLSPGRMAPSAITDARGAFLLDGLPPETLELLAAHPAHASARSGPLDLAASPALGGVVLVLGPCGGLTGEVFTDGGEPAAGRVVTLEGLDRAAQSNLARTDSEGRFAFDCLEPGSWRVIAVDVAAVTGKVADEGGSVRLARVEIVPGGSVHVVLGSPSRQAVVVTGRVLHAGEPHAGAWISFFPAEGGDLQRLALAHVDDDGEYELTLSAPGEYQVSVQQRTDDPEDEDTIDFLRTIPPAAAQRLDFDLPTGSLAGRVFGPDGEPRARCRVSVYSDGRAHRSEFHQGHYAELETDGEGRFAIHGLRADTYVIAAGGSSGTGGEALARIVRSDIALAEGQRLGGIDFHLPAPGSVEVVVRDSEGAPAEGLAVFARDAEGTIVDPVSAATTDGSGRCEVRGLAPGRYSLLARGSGSATAESAAIEVRADERARVELTASRGAMLRVRLLGAQGQPARGWVEVQDERERDVTGLYPADEVESLWLSGAFSPSAPRIGPLLPGRYRVEASAFGGASESRWIVLGGEPELSIDVRLGE